MNNTLGNEKSRTKKTIKIVLIVVGIIVVIGALVIGGMFFVLGQMFGSDASTSKIPVIPCEQNASTTIALGSPRFGEVPAEFTTTGGIIYVTAHSFNHGCAVFLSEVFGSVCPVDINVGDVSVPPTWDSHGSIVPHTIARTKFKDGDFGTINLPAGRYWLWEIGGDDIDLTSCSLNGVSEASFFRRIVNNFTYFFRSKGKTLE
ncbi:MAG: hypothetical protein WC778_11505 [Negativicutes bacterium]|jgi:hypothetical protein